MKKISVLGAGSWGTALAILLADKHQEVYLWGRPEDSIDLIKAERENSKYLPDISLPENIIPTTDLEKTLRDSSVVIFSVPSQAVRQVAKKSLKYLNDQAFIVNTAKGLELNSGMRISEVFQDLLGKKIKENYAILSGPSHAEEVARKIPSAVTIAAYRKETAFFIQDIFMTPSFRVYTNPDVAGVELGGSLKNIIALATGISYGLGCGDNTSAAIITRGLTEITRMGVALGADARTFSGLSGIGDLIVTCGSKYSRNRRAGILIGQGMSMDDTLIKVGMAVEGVHTVKIVNELALKLNVEMPISKAAYNILYSGKTPVEEMSNLMERRKKHETEEMVDNIEAW